MMMIVSLSPLQGGDSSYRITSCQGLMSVSSHWRKLLYKMLIISDQKIFLLENIFYSDKYLGGSPRPSVGRREASCAGTVLQLERLSADKCVGGRERTQPSI